MQGKVFQNGATTSKLKPFSINQKVIFFMTEYRFQLQTLAVISPHETNSAAKFWELNDLSKTLKFSTYQINATFIS